MDATGLIGLSAMTLLLLPPVVTAWEQRRAPDLCHAAIALGGLVYAGWRGGGWGVAAAAAVGLGCMLAVALAVAALRRAWDVHLLSGGHIKLLGAGAVWLGAPGAATMVVLTILAFIGIAALLRARKAARIRPEFAPIAALAMLAVQFQQQLFAGL